MPDIRIDSDAMTAIVTKAILEGISADTQAAIMTQAVEALLVATNPDRGYGYTSEPARTPVQRAFNDAVERAVNKAANDIVAASPEFQAKLDQMVSDAMAALLHDPSEYDLHTKVGQAIGSAVSEWARSSNR